VWYLYATLILYQSYLTILVFTFKDMYNLNVNYSKIATRNGLNYVNDVI